MSRIHEELTANFRAWEERTRGRLVYPSVVSIEPPFSPFPGHVVTQGSVPDDGIRQTLLSSFFKRLWSEPSPQQPPEALESPEPVAYERGRLVELPLSLPAALQRGAPGFEAFTGAMFACQEPIAFELIATSRTVAAQFAVSEADALHVRQQLHALHPDVVTVPRVNTLEGVWSQAAEVGAVIDFGLRRECMLPLFVSSFDVYVPLIGALSELAPDECAVFQVLWQPVENGWAEELRRSVTHPSGKPFFVNAPELVDGLNKKVSRPLYAAVIRIAATSAGIDRTTDILRRVASGLRAFANPQGNELIPLRNDDYPFDDHQDDFLRRQSRRAGMLLNADELVGFVHLPSDAIRSPKFRRQVQKTKPAPQAAIQSNGAVLGENEHAGEIQAVRLSTEQRRQHLHVIGASGTGKTTFLYSLIRQDIERGEGLAVLDPHGDLIDRILGIIPESRIQDVVLIDPGDEDFAIGFNILSAHSDLEKNLLASDLVSVFQRLSTAWGDQMGIVLSNAIRAFLESSKGGTLADLRRFLLEQSYRDRFLETVGDPDIVYYWRKAFSQLAGNKSIGPVMTRLETFLGPKPIRYMVSQRENRLDFAHIIDGGKILLAKLSKGVMGEANSYLLGSLLMAKFQQVAMGRQRISEDRRRDFWLYLDEFHNFITPSTAEILTGARKYRVGLALAHHELRQLQRDPEVSSAVLANPYCRVVFRVGDQDARTLEHGFTSFNAHDLQNLGRGEAICRVERSDFDFNLRTTLPDEPDAQSAAERRQQVIDASRKQYGTPRATIEAELQKLYPTEEGRPKQESKSAGDVLPPRVTRTVPIPKTPVQPESPVTPSSPTPPETKTVVTEIPDPEPLRAEVIPVPKPANRLPVAPAPEHAPPPPVQKSGDAPSIISPVSAPAPPPAPSERPQPRAEEPRASGPMSADAGRGGNQHKAIQKRIKETGLELGFHASVEHQVPEGGSIDVLLTRGAYAVACEIPITCTIDHEVGNVAKCLKAGFKNVAVISTKQKRLEDLKTAVVNSLGSDATRGVQYYLPDDFLAALKSVPQAAVPKAPQTTRVSHGYRIKRSYPNLTPEEAKAREEARIKAIADAMRPET